MESDALQVPPVLGVEPLPFKGVDRAITIAESYGSRGASMTCTGCRPGRARGRRWAAGSTYQEWLQSEPQRTAAPDLHMRPASRAMQARKA
jgi:hypothetical protein